jgi:hypothetical protein
MQLGKKHVLPSNPQKLAELSAKAHCALTTSSELFAKSQLRNSKTQSRVSERSVREIEKVSREIRKAHWAFRKSPLNLLKKATGSFGKVQWAFRKSPLDLLEKAHWGNSKRHHLVTNHQSVIIAV